MRGKALLKVNGIILIVKSSLELSFLLMVLFGIIFFGSLFAAFANNQTVHSFMSLVGFISIFIVGAVYEFFVGFFSVRHCGHKSKANTCLITSIILLCVETAFCVYYFYELFSTYDSINWEINFGTVVFFMLVAISGVVMSSLIISGSVKNENSPDEFSEENIYMRSFAQPYYANQQPYYQNYNYQNPDYQNYQYQNSQYNQYNQPNYQQQNLSYGNPQFRQPVWNNHSMPVNQNDWYNHNNHNNDNNNQQ